MSTIDHTFNFLSSLEGWQMPTPTSTGHLFQRVDSSDSYRPNSIRVNFTSPFGTDDWTDTDYMWWDGTWEDLGVPSDATVIGFSVSSLVRYVPSLGLGGTSTSGPITLHKSDGTLAGTLGGTRTVSTTDSSPVTSSGGSCTVPSTLEAPSSNIEVRISHTDLVDNAGTNVSFYDDIVFTVEYTTDGGIGGDAYTGTASLQMRHPILVASNTFTSNNAKLQTQHPTLNANGIFYPPVYSSNTSLKVKHPLLNTMGTMVPVFHGDANLNIGHPLLNTSGTYRDRGLGDTTLFISGYDIRTDVVPLYISGPPGATGGINLFLKADEVPVSTNSIPLIIQGDVDVTANPVAVGYVPLFINSSALTEYLNLFIEGVRSPVLIGNVLNLVMSGGPPIYTVSGETTLFLMNQQESVSDDISLYIRGLGQNPGYSFSKGEMDLFIQGTGSGTLSVPVYKDLNTTLYINGVFLRRTSLYNISTLFLKTDEAYASSDEITLFISGSLPPSISAEIPLVIYKTSLSKLATLYIHGF